MGLSCALKLHQQGLKVVVLEKGTCGGGATGRSSGFITPDSELSLHNLVEKYGPVKAQRLWEFVVSGVEQMRRLIDTYALPCDYEVQDSLFVANQGTAYASVLSEHQARRQFNYSGQLYTANNLNTALGTDKYFGGLRYNNTFTINAYAYAQELKRVLQEAGIQIFEDSEVIDLGADFALTKHGRVHAKHVIVCIDRWLPKHKLAQASVSAVQTFLGLTEPLSGADAERMFPKGKAMVWDTDLIYSYFRLTPDNRLLIGASSLLYTYMTARKHHHDLVLNKMYSYINDKFPYLDIKIEYFWPGMIGVSKDFLPAVGQSQGVMFGGASAGLPWATAIGEYLADKVARGRHDFDADFAPDRGFTISNNLQKIVPKPLAFAISQGVVKLF